MAATVAPGFAALNPGYEIPGDELRAGANAGALPGEHPHPDGEVGNRPGAGSAAGTRQASPHAKASAGSKTSVASSVTCARPWIIGSTASAGTSGSAAAGRA